MAGGALIEHTFLDKFVSYLTYPVSSILGTLCLVIIIGNLVTLKVLKRRNKYVNFCMWDTTVICITVLICGISAFLVSRIGPHGGVKVDDCDKLYILWAKITYATLVITSLISLIKTIYEYYVDKKAEEALSITEMKKDEENPTIENRIDKKGNNLNMQGFKEKIEEMKETVQDKVDEIKDMFGNKDK